MKAHPGNLKVLLVEDQPPVRDHALTILASLPNIQLTGTAASVSEAVGLIQTTAPDIVLLDIILPDGTAFDILDQLNLQAVKVIFLTAYDYFAVRAIKYGAFDYLLKPFSTKDITDCLGRIQHQATIEQQQVAVTRQNYEQHTENIVLTTQKELHIVRLSEIIYCSSYQGYTTFHLPDSVKVITSKHLKVYEELLPCEQFTRVHQSYIVNNACIKKYRRQGFLLLKDGSNIPVSGGWKDVVLQLIKQNMPYAIGLTPVAMPLAALL